MITTDGTLLGGRVAYRQPATGYRTGLEPVLLAAHCPAQPGDRVLEAGCGAGAGLLCLLTRVPGVLAEGVELDSATAELARHNTGVVIHCTDICDFVPGPVYDHAIANPPWHAQDGTPSPLPSRTLAKQADPALLDRWLRALSALVRPRGTVTIIVPAAQFISAATAARAAGLGGVCLTPIWPRAGVAAKLVLLRGLRGARGPDQVAPGLILHHADGFTSAAEAILRDGAAL